MPLVRADAARADRASASSRTPRVADGRLDAARDCDTPVEGVDPSGLRAHDPARRAALDRGGDGAPTSSTPRAGLVRASTATSARSCSNARTCRPIATPSSRRPGCRSSTPASSSRWFYARSRRLVAAVTPRPRSVVEIAGRHRAARRSSDETPRRLARRASASLRRAARRARRPSGTCPPRIPANNFHTENIQQFANDVDKATRRQAQDPAAPERVAVQGARDQARGAGRPGAGRRDPARQLRERGPALRPRRHSVPRHVVRRLVEALQGVAQGARREAREAGDEAAVHGAVAAAGHLHQAHAQLASPT